MKIKATIGSESHTTSGKWLKIKINGKPVSHWEAMSREFQTAYGDKHATWCDCFFEVGDGDIVCVDAGHNYGPRACNRDRTNLKLRVDLSIEPVEIPVVAGSLTGRLVVVEDAAQKAASTHQEAAADL